MGELLAFVSSQIASVTIPETVAWGREHLDQHKRIKQVEEGLIQLLNSVKTNWYYNDLSRVLMGSNLIADVLNGHLLGKPTPNIDDRINSLLVHHQVQRDKWIEIKGVIDSMCACIDVVMQKPSDSQETRFAYTMNNLQNQIDNVTAMVSRENQPVATKCSSILSLAEVENHSEPIIDITRMIPRKLIENDAKSEDDNRVCWGDILRTKKRIALVNDAGVGKTYALQQLCAQAKGEGYTPVYLSLSKYPGIPLLERLLTYRLIDPQKVILVLDGYDEVKPVYIQKFVTILETIGDRFTNLTIVLSSRSHFFTHHPLEYDLYRLSNITDQERMEYLQMRNIDHVHFFKQIRERKLEDICENAFYFVELVHLWQKRSTLPDEADIMEAIIDSRMRADWEKFKLSSPELSEHMGSLRGLLERIAFIMQCTHLLCLSTEQLERICTKEQCEQLILHGIWENDTLGNWRFSHNNFREYFAACWLRKQPLEQIIYHISWSAQMKKVKPSWTNVLAYMAKMKGSHDLRDWIALNDPTIITLFEQEQLSVDQRFLIFQRIYDHHEENMTWAEIDYDARKQMGKFASSSAAVSYILDKLTKRMHLRQIKNLLRVMAFFDELYGHEEDCKMVISSIAFDNDYPDHVRADALDVMREFPQVFVDYVQTAAEVCMQSDSMHYRYHLQRFIESTGKLEDYFEIVLHELVQKEKEDDASDITRKLFLDKICSTVKANSAVLRLFDFACEHPEYIDQDPFEKGWPNLFDVALHCEDTYRNSFTHVILKLFSEAQHRYCPSIDHFIKGYMVETKTEKVFLESILSYEGFAVSYAIQRLSCPSLVDLLVEYYDQDRLPNSKIPEQVVQRLSSSDPMVGRLVKAVCIKTGIVIPIPQTVDYKEANKKGRQIYFDALFSKSEFAALVDDLGSVVGNEAQVNETHYLTCDPLARKIALSQCLHTLHRIVPDDCEITIGQVVDWIKDWDWFQYFHASNAINKDIQMSAAQRAWMEHYTWSNLSGIDPREINRAVFSEHECTLIHPIFFRTMAKLDMAFPTEFLCSLILIPRYWFGESGFTEFPKYLLNHIPAGMMSELVLNNIQHETLRGDMAATHLSYCTQHRLYGVKDFAVEFLSRDESEGFRYSALHYLTELYGVDVIINDVVPLREDERFLRDIAYHIPLHIPAPLLDEKLEATYLQNSSQDLQELLIKRNNRKALEIYLHHAQTLRTLPDMTQGSWVPAVTESIRCVNDVGLMDLLIQLLRLCNEPDFIDKECFGLRNSCWEAIKNIALTHYVEVKAVLTDEMHHAYDDQKLTCIDLLQRIEECYQFEFDNGIDFETALVWTME